MFGLRSLSILAVVVVCGLADQSTLALAETEATGVAMTASRNLRAQQANVIPPGGGDVNPNTGVKNPGGILGPLYAAFPGLLAPLAMASDNVHNSNAAVSGVQHTPDGIFQA
jgi:hypothetical protein